ELRAGAARFRAAGELGEADLGVGRQVVNLGQTGELFPGVLELAVRFEQRVERSQAFALLLFALRESGGDRAPLLLLLLERGVAARFFLRRAEADGRAIELGRKLPDARSAALAI